MFDFHTPGHQTLPSGDVVRMDYSLGMYLGSYFEWRCRVWQEPRLEVTHQFWGSLAAVQQEIAIWLGESA